MFFGGWRQQIEQIDALRSIHFAHADISFTGRCRIVFTGRLLRAGSRFAGGLSGCLLCQFPLFFLLFFHDKGQRGQFVPVCSVFLFRLIPFEDSYIKHAAQVGYRGKSQQKYHGEGLDRNQDGYQGQYFQNPRKGNRLHPGFRKSRARSRQC